jgi:hypothetical protein
MLGRVFPPASIKQWRLPGDGFQSINLSQENQLLFQLVQWRDPPGSP